MVSAAVSLSCANIVVLGRGGFVASAADCLNAFALSPNMTGRSRRGLEARGVGLFGETAFSSLVLGWTGFRIFGGTQGAGYCEGSSGGLLGTCGAWELELSSTEGAGMFQLNDGCWVMFEADGGNEGVEIESKEGSDFGAKTAVGGGCVVVALVFRGLEVVKGLSKRESVPVLGGGDEGGGLAGLSENSSCEGRGEGGGFGRVRSLPTLSNSP